MSLYVKHEGKKGEGEDRDKIALANLASTMVSHGQDFSPDSEFGGCLTREFCFLVSGYKNLG